MMILLHIIIFIISVLLAKYTIPVLVDLSRQLHLYDMPDSRKTHKLPIPRLGGVAFLPAVLIAVSMAYVCMIRIDDEFVRVDKEFLELTTWDLQHLMAYLAGCLMLYFVGMYDDINGLGYKFKLIVQFVAGFLLCAGGLWIADFENIFWFGQVPFWVGMPLSVLLVVYVTNAMNLIDGIDGLASGISCLAFAMIAMISVIRGEWLVSMISVAFIGVLLVFFVYNVFGERFKVFMGDAGSLTIGYTLSFAGLTFWRVHPITDPHLHNLGIIVMSPLVIPLLDVLRVLGARIQDGCNPFIADKNHIHHKLMRAGLSGWWTMLTILLLTVLFSLSNYLVAVYVSQTLLVMMDIALFIVMHLVINVFIYRKGHKGGEHRETPSVE